MIKRERKKGNLEISENEYATLLHEIYIHSPEIKKRIKTMKKRYPNLSEECYEIERHYLIQKKVENDLLNDFKPIRKAPNQDKLYKQYEKAYKKMNLYEYKPSDVDFNNLPSMSIHDLSPQIQHAMIQEKVDEIKHLEAELPYVESKNEEKAIATALVELVKEIKQIKKPTKKLTKKQQEIEHIMNQIDKLQYEKDALGPIKKENPNFEELSSIYNAIVDKINALHRQLPKRKKYVRKAKGQGIQRRRIRRY